MENVADICIPVSKEKRKVWEHNYFVQLKMSPNAKTNHQSMFSIKEILIKIDKCDDLLEDLNVRHSDQTL